MADTKISALTAASAAADTNEFAINEAGTSKKLTGAQIKHFARTSLSPSGALGETIIRNTALNFAMATLTTGKLLLSAIYLFQGTTITNISMCSSNVAAASPTNWWFALYDGSRNLLRQTADQTTTAWGSSTVKTLALTSPYEVTTSGVYYVGESMVATTVNNLTGALQTTMLNGLAPILVGLTADTGLTSTAPNPAGAITVSSSMPYINVT